VPITLLVAGEGPLRPKLERDAQVSTRILGHRADVPRLLAAADFFVLVSRREGLSFALVEAMAYGLPAVVTDIPENLEAIGDSGFAVQWGDHEALMIALRRLAENGTERAVLGERARRRVAKLFDADDMISRTRAVYDEVCGRQP
jgi:glycosyltransferase involved in cell wall biosynthesis